MNAFVAQLMDQMTLEEKIGQLNLASIGFDITGPRMSKNVEKKIRDGLVGGVFNTYTPVAVRKLQEMAVKDTRLHIPLLFGYDVVHGHKTIFPMPIGLACTWDMALVQETARIAANEAAADGVNWTFAPMVDLARDPRWGRIAEGAGEDPYLGSQIAAAMVKGFQGEDLTRSNALMACVKHFALYGAAEAGRDYNTVDMSLLKMFQYYLPPYKAAVDAGVGSVMCSFNEVNSVPATGDRWLLTDVLRGKWGFKGFVVTDYTGVQELTVHGMGDLKKDAELALNAGVDMDMVSEAFLGELKGLLEAGVVPQANIDQACRRILEAKYKLGLFDDPYRGCSDDRARSQILTAENRQAAREAAERACVLLKNGRRVLPLKKAGTIALIGPLADNQRDLLGSWRGAGDWTKAVSLRDGIKRVAGDKVKVLYATGANLTDDAFLMEELNPHGAGLVPDKRSPQAMLEEAVAVARKADIIVAVLGESFGMSGEAASRSQLDLPDSQKDLLRALVKTGRPLVLVLMNGRPLTLTWEDANCDAILETWFGGTEAGNGIAEVLFGGYNPSGKLTASFPRNVGQIPVYYNHKNTGRPYRGKVQEKFTSRYLDVPNDPLYAFGYGLSYTTFSYGEVKLNKTHLKGSETLTANVSIKNTGSLASDEIVQLYITDPVASVTRSVLDLKGFQKISLKPGESKDVTFNITTEDLKFFNADLKYDWEPGEFIIRVGPNSAELHSAAVQWEK